MYRANFPGVRVLIKYYGGIITHDISRSVYYSCLKYVFFFSRHPLSAGLRFSLFSRWTERTGFLSRDSNVIVMIVMSESIPDTVVVFPEVFFSTRKNRTISGRNDRLFAMNFHRLAINLIDVIFAWVPYSFCLLIFERLFIRDSLSTGYTDQRYSNMDQCIIRDYSNRKNSTVSIAHYNDSAETPRFYYYFFFK